MTTTELCELDAWIAEHVMGLRVASGRASVFKTVLKNLKSGETRQVETSFAILEYTTDPAAAMMVLDRCQDQAVNIEMWKTSDGNYWVTMPNRAFFGRAETLPLAICQFAKQLFTK